MNNFEDYGDIFKGRYADAVKAANSQRRADQQPTEEFDSYVQSGFDQELNGPTPPEEPESPGQVQEAQFDDENENVDRTKNYLLNQAKTRMAEVADM